MMKPRYLPLFTLCLMISGCAVGPDYVRPEVSIPHAFKEAPGWKRAEPADTDKQDHWWTHFGDATLNQLVSTIDVSNQNIQIADAQFRQAQALLNLAQAGLFPTLGTTFTGTRSQGITGTSSSTSSGAVIPSTPIRNADRFALNAAWELDVWGRIRRNIEAGEASLAASSADLGAARLSAQNAFVQAYLQLRVNESQQQLLEETVRAYERSLSITRNRFDAGVVGRIDVAQAEAQLKTAQAQRIDLDIQRAQLEHALALLLGRAPADFSLPRTATLPKIPPLPRTLPAELLERRPDIAAAEHRVAAANAQIGIAQSAFFPSIVFNASGGYQSSSLSELFTVPNRFWSLGPTLALSLFDAGARSAQKEQAIAAYDKSVATYRQTVLTAFQEVEDNLATLRILAEEAEIQGSAAQFAAESLRLVNHQYSYGTVSYLNVISAQTAALNAEQSRINILGRRLLATAALFKALGGDWQERPVDTASKNTATIPNDLPPSASSP